MELQKPPLKIRRLKLTNYFSEYENGINRLNEILEILEKGNVSLEENVILYEEGVKLHSKLSNILNKEEGKIKIISESNKDINELSFLDD